MMSPDAVAEMIINLATEHLIDATREQEPQAFSEAHKIVERVYWMTGDEGENVTNKLEQLAMEAIAEMS